MYTKNVKISAKEILNNLVTDGKPIIPANAFVYISTDDPDGLCKNCFVQRKPCTSYAAGQKPVGCPEDVCVHVFTVDLLITDIF